MRVLLVYSNQTRDLILPPPIGLSYVASATRRAGHAVRFLDLLTARAPRAALRSTLREFQPEVVGFSVRNIDNIVCQRLNSDFDELARFIRLIRTTATGTPIVLGGPAISVLGARAFERLDADYAVRGEGEAAFPDLLAALATGRDPSGIPGVCVRDGDPSPDQDPARLPAFGASGMQDWIDWRPYHRHGSTFAIQTKRGCYFECVFCSYPLIEGSRVRMRSPRSVVDEIEAARAELGARHWFFVDNIFNMPIRHCKEICEEIAARDLDIEWSGYLNPKFVDDELCDLMARSGCKAIEFGTDSGSPTMIANLKKEFEVGDLRRSSELCHRHGLKFCHSLIFGGPGETLQTVSETIELMDQLRPTAVIAMTGIRILPGTGMVEIALRDGQIDPDDNLLYPKFYVSPNLGDELIERIESYARAHSNWIVPGQGIRTNVRVLQKLRDRKIKGQLWRLLR